MDDEIYPVSRLSRDKMFNHIREIENNSNISFLGSDRDLVPT